MNALMVIVGASFGALLRYYINIFIAQHWQNFPYATLTVNIIGSFLAGIFVVFILEKNLLGETWRLLLLVGFLGSLTTFSTFSFETLIMFENGLFLKALVNIGLNLLLSLAAVFLGAVIVRFFTAV
ncbi:CrcB protein [hydrothermal vent metagenome]|uniref:CrcB protein n=1 Tax=hydrothermal vent metagenome TaxID=652676 RepID=A0A1W1CRD7_9ZZZZ